MLLLAAATLSFGRSALLRPPTPLLRHRAPVCTVSEAAPETDLVGDGGVLKRVLQAGNGESPVKGTTVEVHYDGTLLSTGARFDSSRERGKVRFRAAGPSPHHRHRHRHRHHHHHRPPPQTFKFTLGEGKVIGGWEVGVASMKPGELSVLTCSPSYACVEEDSNPDLHPSPMHIRTVTPKPGPRLTSTLPLIRYGDKGIPPIIPPSSALQFEVELLSVQVTPTR